MKIFNANNSVITLGRSASATGDNGAISFGKVVNSFPYSGAKSLDILNYSSGNINFYLEAGNIGVNTGNFHWHRRGDFDRLMTLTYQGSLGIGETQPNHNLHVVGTSTVTSNAFFGNNVNIKVILHALKPCYYNIVYEIVETVGMRRDMLVSV